MPERKPPTGDRGGSRFLSLKWKVLLTLGAVMLSVNGVLSWLHYQDLMTRFDEQRAETRARLAAQAFALRNEVGLRLQALAGVLAALDSVGVTLFPTSAGNALLRQHFDSYWPALQYGYGIDSLQVYLTGGEQLAAWTSSGGPEVQPTVQVTEVINSERATSWTNCSEVCTEYAAAPILSAGKVAGAVVVGSSLAEVVNSFQRVTGADLGVLVPHVGPLSEASGDEAFLPRLGLRAIPLSSMGSHRPLLRQLQSLPQTPPGPAHAYLSLPYDGRQFELSFLVLDFPAAASRPATMVVIDDLTLALVDIHQSVVSRLQGELLVSLVSLLLLSLLVNAPLQRMARTANAIPLLGRSAFAEARRRIAPRPRRLVEDEIDRLDEAAIDLSYRLETLERDVAAHAAVTEGMLQRISVERDFSRSLLDTAQVIVLTQSAAGRILTLNRYGRQLAGLGEEQLAASSFFELIGGDSLQVAAARQAVHEIASGDRQHVQLESILQGKGGESYEITWNHSRLAGQPGDAVMVLSVGVDHTERKYLAERDPLTGLVNRRHFQDILRRALVDARRSRRDGALLYLDLDAFKYVNDVSGHQAGDALLKIVAEEVAHVARTSDRIGRLGGDELGVLLHECDSAGAVQVAEKINRRLAEIKFPGLGANHRVSASIGIVVFSAAKMNAELLLTNADIAMYQAKSKGGGGWHVYSEGEGVQERMQNRLHWEEMINRALANDGFIVHYQPILDIASRKVSHFEALVRMRAGDGGVVPPGMFMEVAESSGLIREIDRHVTGMVLARMELSRRAGRRYRFSINLSGVSINDASLLSFLREKLAQRRDLAACRT
ncbi:MAG: diguanylate cyclase [Accumulibacter sp.]|jgi:diguanylate cyclase (GGDEF)-like protein/PAS domain S-box-containing protein